MSEKYLLIFSFKYKLFKFICTLKMSAFFLYNVYKKRSYNNQIGVIGDTLSMTHK